VGLFFGSGFVLPDPRWAGVVSKIALCVFSNSRESIDCGELDVIRFANRYLLLALA